MKRAHLSTSTAVCILLLFSLAAAQAPADKADTRMVNRIWEEGTTHSQVMSLLRDRKSVV